MGPSTADHLKCLKNVWSRVLILFLSNVSMLIVDSENILHFYAGNFATINWKFIKILVFWYPETIDIFEFQKIDPESKVEQVISRISRLIAFIRIWRYDLMPFL